MSLRSVGLLGALALTSLLGSYLIYESKFGLKLNFKTRFKEALLDLSTEEFWEEKWKKLRDGEVYGENLNLIKAKKVWNLEKMKDACKEIYEAPFEGTETNNFLNFKAYCAFTNIEKLSNLATFKVNKEICEEKKDDLYLSELDFKKFKDDCSGT